MAIGVPLCRMAQKRANAPELPAAAATAASMRVLAAAVIVCKITEMWSSSRGECRGGAKGASGARGAMVLVLGVLPVLVLRVLTGAGARVLPVLVLAGYDGR